VWRPSHPQVMNIGYVGLGKMGSGIARNLLTAGHQLIVYNRDREKAEVVVKDGAQIASSPAEAASASDVVMTMLSDDHAVEQVVLGDKGITSGLKRNTVHISNSTISTTLARRLANEHQHLGQGYLSAPVFGRPEAAEAKKLVVVVAGEESLIERFRPLLDAIGRKTIVTGTEPWQANAVKLCGNFMIASMMEAFGEAYAVIRKSGMQPLMFLDVMNELFNSPVYANYGGIIANEKFEPAAFTLKLGLKDIRLVLAAAEEIATPMPFASVLRDNLISALAENQEDLDWSSVAKIAARNAGLT
jgi:3-hydroxyisobutyrate dehydrogenase-like beta-hydroxyacid dehydrogenase